MADVTGSQSGLTQAFTRGPDGQILGHQSALQQQFVQRGTGILQGTGSPYQLGSSAGGDGGSGGGDNGGGDNGGGDPGGGQGPIGAGTGVPLQLISLGGDRYRIENFADAWSSDYPGGALSRYFIDRDSNQYYVLAFDTYVPPSSANPGHWQTTMGRLVLASMVEPEITAILDRTASIDTLNITLAYPLDLDQSDNLVNVMTGWYTDYARYAGGSGSSLSINPVEADHIVRIDLPPVPAGGGGFGLLQLSAQTNSAQDPANSLTQTISRSGTRIEMAGSLTPPPAR